MSTTLTWDPSWTADTTIGSSHNDGAPPDQSAEYTTNTTLMFEFSVRGTYSAGVYDGPALFYVLRKTEAAATYEDQVNAHMIVPLNGSSGASFNKVITVGPEVNAFILEIDNDSNLNISGFSLHYKKGVLVTT